MKILLDENISHLHVVSLKSLGIDAVSAVELGLAGKADEKIREEANRTHRAIVTLDLDFSNITRKVFFPASGTIVLRLKHPTESVIDHALAQIPTITQDIAGCLVVIEEDKIRIRKW